MSLLQKSIAVSLCCILITKLTCAQYDTEESILDYEDGMMNDAVYNPQLNTPEPFSRFGFEPPTIEESFQLTATVRSLHNFSFDIFNSINQDDSQEQNMVISTLSIFTTMVMLRPGLGGESLRQMNVLLGNERINNVQIGNALDDIFSDDHEYQLDYASRVYVDKSVNLRKPYKRELSKLKVALAKRVDFAKNPEESRRKINNYVRRKTRRLINEMVPEGGISARTKIYLINALYLKAKWEFRFNSENTEMKEFHLDNRNSIMVSTMHTDFAPCNFYRDTNHQADIAVLSLHENLSMLFIMPQNTGNFSRLFDDEQDSMRNKFSQIINEVWPEEDNRERFPQACSIDLPKFSLDYEANLINSLRRLGLRDVFDMNDANLSHMTQRKTDNLYVSDALHKAVLTADEEGIEAAASTSLGITVRRAADVRVNINKPFLFAIRQDLTGAILFVGKVVRP